MTRVMFCIAELILCCSLAVGQAQERVLYSFGTNPNDGVEPIGDLIFDKAGNLYGVTQGGGTGSGVYGGTVFKVTPNHDGSWTETVLYNFCSNYVNSVCIDGTLPQAGLALDTAGNLYGTTFLGGANVACSGDGCGVVFELSPPSFPGGVWTESVIYNFCANVANNQCLDGNTPASQLTLDSSGNLYGTAGGGGSSGGGVVFELSSSANGWAETVLYNFCSLGQGNICPDGDNPRAGVIFDKYANLYGTTQAGGSADSVGGGTIYKLSPSFGVWTENVLFASAFPVNGSDPQGKVSFDESGTLYTTFASGGRNMDGGVLRLAPSGLGHEFWFDGSDGASPQVGVLVDSERHALFGATGSGGKFTSGTVFTITSPENESLLYSFCELSDCADGKLPGGGITKDKKGNLYGSTRAGGAAGNRGVIFEITP